MSTSKRAALLALGVAFVAACDDNPNAPNDNAGISSADELVEAFESFYAGRDYDGFVSLLADDPGNAAEFQFIPPVRTIERSWGRAQESQIHRRMFDPDKRAPGEPAVPNEYKLTAIYISLEQQGEWEEQPQLYLSATNPGGLPPRSGRRSRRISQQLCSSIHRGTSTFLWRAV